MNSLFGISINSVMVALVALMGAACAVFALIAWRNPLLVRMGLRNVARRRAQTTLIVVGLMLSTLIISTAFATGDTVSYSVTNAVYNVLEEVDFVIGPDPRRVEGVNALLPPDYEQALRARFAADPQIDGVSGLLVKTLPIVNAQRRLSQPQGNVVGVDPATVDAFHGLRAPDGATVSASVLGGDRALITARLAKEIDARVGDTITVYIDNRPHTLTVTGLLRDTLITGTSSNSNLGAAVVHMETLRALAGLGAGVSYISVSTAGGVRDAAALRDPAIEDRLQAFMDGQSFPARFVMQKEQLVNLAQLIGSAFVSIFLVFGLFSIAAGIMLIFLIFVMLAAERRAEMGMARAVGMSRLHLTQGFISEGMAYNLGAAAVGGLLGVGVARALVLGLQRIAAGSDVPFDITFHVKPQGFVIAYSLGVVLTFVTVAFSAWRAANLNIVRAIRDLPEPQPLRGANRSPGGLLGATLGALWTVAWVAFVALVMALGVQLFFIGLAFYGLPWIGAAAIIAAFALGARVAARRSALATVHGWRRALYLLWWVVFTAAAGIAPITWGLLRTRRWAARRRNPGGWAIVMLITGLVLVSLGGWGTHWLFFYTGGLTLVLLAVAMLAVYFGAGARSAFTVAGLLAVWYWLLPLPFSLLGDWGTGFRDPLAGVLSRIGAAPDPNDGGIEMFFVSGICITAAATLVVIFNSAAFLGLVSAAGRWAGRITPALRTAIAYPLAAQFRTAITLAMFCLIVFSLVVMAFINHNFTAIFTGDQARAGFDVRVSGNPSNRIPDLRAALRDTGYDTSSIARVAHLVSAFPLMQASGTNAPAGRYGLLGVDDEFLAAATLPMRFRARGYDSDGAVIAALRSDPAVAIVDSSRLRTAGGLLAGGGDGNAPTFQLPVSEADLVHAPAWDPIAVTVRRSDGSALQLKIIAVLDPQVTNVITALSAVYTTDAIVQQQFGGGDVDTFLVTTTTGSKQQADHVAKDIESALLERGVQADALEQIVDDATSTATAFQLLFEGFMGLGLIVGIAALGVIAFRSVVERRQQIGMLRAIGYSRGLVGLSFFLESSFIALTGIAMGLLLGGALAYNLLTSDAFTAGVAIDVSVPWVRLLLIAGVAYGASALMTLIPARAASRVPVAQALRYE